MIKLIMYELGGVKSRANVSIQPLKVSLFFMVLLVIHIIYIYLVACRSEQRNVIS